jgi:uncharacterized membrane protein
MQTFLKTTIVGGVIFLLPVALVLVVLGHAFRLALKSAVPMSHAIHVEQIGPFGGVGVATLIAIVLLIIISFLAGLIARTRPGASLSHWLEQSLVGSMPQYKMVKSLAEGLAQVESSNNLEPALVSVDGGWQLAYVLERLDNGWIATFIPQAPTPMSGNVMYFTQERVRPLAISIAEAMQLVKRIGIGSRAALNGMDLSSPAQH